MFSKEEFDKQGFIVIPNFVSENLIQDLKNEALNLVMSPDRQDMLAFTTNTNSKLYNDTYFLDSNDKVRLFYEPSAFNENGELKVKHEQSVNKIGHALHILNPTFRKFSFNPSIKDVLKTIGYVKPTIVQSMYIFKQPNIGNALPAHQDATYLHTIPQNGVGLWIALDDADVSNGCLQFIPGSHLSGLHDDLRLVRELDGGKVSCHVVGTQRRYDDEDFVPTPVKKGSLVLIDALVVHKSDDNVTDRPRNAYTLHIYDASVAQWDNKNWLQPSTRGNFERLF